MAAGFPAQVLEWQFVQLFISACFSQHQIGQSPAGLIFHATNNTLGSFSTDMVEKKDTKREVLLHLATGTFLIIPFGLLLLGA